MAWAGWMEYGGTEFINVARTEAYVRNANVSWFRNCYGNSDMLPIILGESYASPLQDDAPWTDPNNPDTYGFYGVYPLDVSGVENSTATAAITESTVHGGVVGRVRNTTKTMVFNVVLLGQDECAVEAGFRWLKDVIAGNQCGPWSDSQCAGDALCYLACPPACVEDTDGTGCPDCLIKYQRSLRSVGVTVGPAVTGKRTTIDGSEVWTVTFTLAAGDPFEYGVDVPIVEGFMDPAVEVPFFGGAVPEGASFDDVGFTEDEVDCAMPTYQPVVDPLCTFITPPPEPPPIELSCFDFPVRFTRRQFVLPEQFVPIWGEVVPSLEIHAKNSDIRNLRIRFYPDFLATGDPSQDACNFCGDLVVSYIPQGSTLFLDGAANEAYVVTAGNIRQRSNHLLFSTSGRPFEWPSLTCGMGYVVTIDLPITQPTPVVDLSLCSRVM